MEVTRHGERQSGKLFSFAANPEEEFKVAYNLTETGAQSHFANGKAVREFFDKHDDFLSAEYNPEEVYVQTTYKQRTLDSALA